MGSGHNATSSARQCGTALLRQSARSAAQETAWPWGTPIACILLLFLQRGAQSSQAGSSYSPGAYQSFASAPAEAMGAQQGAPRMFAGEVECSSMQRALGRLGRAEWAEPLTLQCIATQHFWIIAQQAVSCGTLLSLVMHYPDVC